MVSQEIGSPELRRVRRTRRRNIGPTANRRFMAYLTFGPIATCLFCVISFLYVIFLLCALPMLRYDSSQSHLQAHNKAFERAFEGIRVPQIPSRNRIKEALKAEEEQIVHVADTVKKKLLGSHGNDLDASELMDAAIEKFNRKRENKQKSRKQIPQKRVHNQIRRAKNEKTKEKPNSISLIPPDEKKTGGFILLGMHRSGTSMLSGMLVNGMGYKVGAPLIGAAPDNPKGFFELLPAVLQNDEFLKSQGAWWAANVAIYDSQKVLDLYKKNMIPVKELKSAMTFLQNEKNFPWMQKDPRMCITLRTWLPLLDTKPAVVFTYRNPLSVALSLKTRQGFDLEHTLRLWIVYNMKAIQNSNDLCRVLSNNERILDNPSAEVQRISDELTSKCNVPKPSQLLNEEVISNFIDVSLQHSAKKGDMEKEKRILIQHGDCEIQDYDSELEMGSIKQKTEKEMYLKAMTIFCDLGNGDAYKTDYSWPKLSYA